MLICTRNPCHSKFCNVGRPGYVSTFCYFDRCASCVSAIVRSHCCTTGLIFIVPLIPCFAIQNRIPRLTLIIIVRNSDRCVQLYDDQKSRTINCLTLVSSANKEHDGLSYFPSRLCNFFRDHPTVPFNDPRYTLRLSIHLSLSQRDPFLCRNTMFVNETSDYPLQRFLQRDVHTGRIRVA